MTTPYWSDFVQDSTFYRILSGFHRTFATGVACRQGTLTPPDTWSRPFGTCIIMFYLLRPILFPNLSLLLRTMLFEYPSVLSRFYLDKGGMKSLPLLFCMAEIWVCKPVTVAFSELTSFLDDVHFVVRSLILAVMMSIRALSLFDFAVMLLILSVKESISLFDFVVRSFSATRSCWISDSSCIGSLRRSRVFFSPLQKLREASSMQTSNGMALILIKRHWRILSNYYMFSMTTCKIMNMS